MVAECGSKRARGDCEWVEELEIVERVSTHVNPVEKVSVVTEDTCVGCGYSLCDIRAGTGVQEIGVGNDRSEGRPSSLITSRSTRHVSHLDAEFVASSK